MPDVQLKAFLFQTQALIHLKWFIVIILLNKLTTTCTVTFGHLKPWYMIFFQNVCLHFSNLSFWHICNVYGRFHENRDMTPKIENHSWASFPLLNYRKQMYGPGCKLFFGNIYYFHRKKSHFLKLRFQSKKIK